MTVAASSAAIAPTRLRAATLHDYDAIRRLGLAHELDVPEYGDWSGLWRDNPVRTRLGRDYPIGWVLETERGDVVGCMGTVHSPYAFRGQDLIAAVARAWFVYPPYRPMALELMDAYLNQPGVDLAINNAVSAPAHDAFAQFCTPIPLGQWDSISYWTTQEGSRARVPRSGISFAVEAVDRFDSQFDTFWKELRRQNSEVLLAQRSAEILAWHFGNPMRKGRLWTFAASRNGRLRAYCTLTRQDHAFRLPALPHDDAQAITSMRLVDYQSLEPDVDFLPELLRAALERCRREHLHVLEMLGRGVPKMRVVDEYAPHCKKLENWKFYYRAADAALDAELRRPEFWDPSGYDGDVSFE